jgi:hypothetical protein
MYDQEIAFRVESIKREVCSSLGRNFYHEHPDAMARIIAAVIHADALARLTDAISFSSTEVSGAVTSHGADIEAAIQELARG